MPTAAYLFPMWFLHQPMKSEAEPVMMWCLALPHTVCANFPLTSVTNPQAWGSFSLLLSRMKWERAYEREKSIITYWFSVPVVVTSRSFGRLFQKTGFVSIPRLCDCHFDLFAISAVRRSHTNRKGWLCTIYLQYCTWEATLQCLVECIFESGSTLKWLVIMFFLSPYLQIFQYLNCRIFNFSCCLCVYLCRCSEEAASRCHWLRNERSGNNLAHSHRQQGQQEEGERGSKKG